ncbi:VWA domain-containing protein [Stenotrophomonas sp. SY1]|uniref:VWA domain-containing protein n=1 Tax=Stenotrophomonas sp. SY1 TaxID=477235 RepID=UPI001E610238|nr:VWA domain-containing protein [Stenotrophomonas sp. SY1]MCD9085545.1 VWA domain-containing protein [Stenotrophomonas sp. SY1]
MRSSNASRPYGLPARSVALAAAVTLLIGLPVTAAVRPAPPAQPAVEGDLQAPVSLRVRQTQPNFRGPSARTCNNMPVLHEVADPSPTPPRHISLRSRHSTAEAGYADAAAAEVYLAPPVMPAPPAPPPPAAPSTRSSAMSDSVPAAAKASPSAPASGSVPAYRQQQTPVTAGVVDDNTDFGGFQQFLQRHEEATRLGRDISVRQRLQVIDAQGRPVPDAEVAVSSANGARMWARTDAGGQVWLHPNAFDDRDSSSYQVQVRRAGKTSSAALQRGQKNVLQVVMPAATLPARAKLDLVFMVDATGSMADEIDKLRDSLQGIVNEIGQLPSNPDICLGLVTYRDRGDEYFVRGWDMTYNIAAFQKVLDGVRANGGGDYPEAMNEAFDHAVQGLNWRGPSTTRVLVSLADAPPQMGYPPPRYDQTMLAALGKGIKVFSVAASGQDTTGEIVQRQIAQYTGGRFIFLTYKDASDPSSGPGSETVHEVANYSVDTLDQLVVRLVREELAQLPVAGKRD